MLKHLVGDLVESDERVIVHGCNCFHTMGAGIARQLMKKWPGVLDADKETKYGDANKLGTVSYYMTQDVPSRYIINLYSQYRPANAKECVLIYSALTNGLLRVCQLFQDMPVIAMPRIGCGLAGGSWEWVEQIMEKAAHVTGKTFHIYTLPGESDGTR